MKNFDFDNDMSKSIISHPDIYYMASMYVCISLFIINQINSTTMTNKNPLTLHTNENLRHDLVLYLLLLQSYMYRARFILDSGEHKVLRFIQ